jgi:glycosyltransferase involved in cell wall biosynthesis
MTPQSNNKIAKKNIWCVIPVYNNSTTIKQVIEECYKYLDNILVIDDGSTDCDINSTLKCCSAKVIKHKFNKGKGAALKTACEYLLEQNADYMITLDGDGQHYPKDIPKFISAIGNNKHTLAIGYRDFEIENVPNSSKFGRSFSNMWVRLETGLKIKDTQSGFRAYPVKYISKIKTLTNTYNFEIEIIVKAAWKGLIIKDVPISVYYPKPEERISSFKPLKDNFKLSLIHTYLIALRLLPISNKKFIKGEDEKVDYSIIFHPIKLLKTLLKEHTSPEDLGLAAFIGTILAVFPIPGFHSVAILYVATRFKLNRVMAFNIQHLFMPPITPLLCIELGHYIIYQQFLIDISFQTVIMQMPHRILEWIVGSIILAPIFAIITGFTVYFISKIINTRKIK